MKVFVIFWVVLFLLIGGPIAWYRWDSAINRGSEYGYYGEFNRVSNALATIPTVTITQAWHNLDVSLEEFGFGVVVTGQPVRLFFSETDPIRTMKRDAATAALQKRIDMEILSSQVNK